MLNYVARIIIKLSKEQKNNNNNGNQIKLARDDNQRKFLLQGKINMKGGKIDEKLSVWFTCKDFVPLIGTRESMDLFIQRKVFI